MAAAATEEPRLLGSAPGVEDAAEIDGAVGEQGRPRGVDDDEEILRFMDSVDGYLLLMDSLSSALRQGWLDLASARHSMGPSRVSSTLLDHKEQSAATKLQVVDHAGLTSSESKPHFALSKWSLQEESHSTYDVSEQASTEPKLRHRGSATTPDGNHERDATTADSSTGADTSNHVQRARSKALSVFGALVSPPAFLPILTIADSTTNSIGNVHALSRGPRTNTNSSPSSSSVPTLPAHCVAIARAQRQSTMEQQQQGADAAAAARRMATLASHLRADPASSHPQMEEVPLLRGSICRAKGAAPGFKVAILGAAGGIGQPLALLMKMNPLVSVLHLYDVVNTPGVTADISHMNTGAVVRGFLGQPQLENALTGMDLVIIPAGVPRKPGMTRDDLFNINAGIVRTLCEGIAKCCPKAIVNVISNPVNSTVPIAAEVFKKAGTYDPKRLLGVTTLDVVRANTFVGEVLGLDPREVNVPVIGGHAGVTILPLLSQVNPACSFTSEEVTHLTSRIQNGGTEVVEAKAGAGSATLSMAYAAAKFADACLRGLHGDAGIVECSYVASQVTELPFFASKVRLGRTGVEEILPLGPMNEFERAGLEKAKKELSESIQKGVSFINK